MCLCACVPCEQVFACAGRHLRTYVCVQEEPKCNTGSFTQSLSTLYVEIRSLSEPKDHQLGQAGWPVSSWELPIFTNTPPSTGIAGLHLGTWLDTRAPGMEIEVLTLVQQALYQLSITPSAQKACIGYLLFGLRGWADKDSVFRKLTVQCRGPGAAGRADWIQWEASCWRR